MFSSPGLTPCRGIETLDLFALVVIWDSHGNHFPLSQMRTRKHVKSPIRVNDMGASPTPRIVVARRPRLVPARVTAHSIPYNAILGPTPFDSSACDFDMVKRSALMIGSTANNHEVKMGASTVRRASGAYSDIDTSPQGDLASRYNQRQLRPSARYRFFGWL